MSYYDEKYTELSELLNKIEKEKQYLEALIEKNETDKEAIIQMSKERQVGFPWLGAAYEEFFKLQDKELVDFLKYKKHPAIAASETVKATNKLRREAVRDKKIAEYLVEYYESICPFLLDLKEEVVDLKEEEKEMLSEYTEEELRDSATKYLTKEEFRKLPTVEKNQMALDRYWKRPKSKWHIGRCYERYVGFLFEEKGYDVEYIGIFKGLEDLGRDLICRNKKEHIVIQCKYWAKFRTIYEKHIFQFFGTVFKYKDDNPSVKVRGMFYATTKLSGLAKRFGQELKMEIIDNQEFNKDYPCIKCNVSRKSNNKIYHLPFDQQYDKTKIEPERDEFYCKTVKEAENAGFRRAFKYSGLSRDSKKI